MILGYLGCISCWHGVWGSAFELYHGCVWDYVMDRMGLEWSELYLRKVLCVLNV